MEICNFMSPLTLEAKMFLNTLKKLQDSPFPLDSSLCVVLEDIIKSIQSLIGNSTGIVLQTARTKVVDPEVVNNLKQSYHCTPCKQDLGKTTVQVVKHLIECHTGSIGAAGAEDDKENVRPRNGVVSKQNIRGAAGRGGSVASTTSRDNSLKKKKLKKKENKKNKTTFPVPKKLTAFLQKDLSNFFMENITIAEKLKTMPQYEQIENDLMKTLEPLFPNASIRLYKFGSRTTGIATRNSDLDIFVDIDNVSHTHEIAASAMTLKKLETTRQGLRKAKAWTSLIAVRNARVPILKMRHVRTCIEIDLGFSNSLGYFNSKLMEYFFNLQPLARRMCVYLKKWLGFGKLNEFVPTYSVILMVVFFFQLRNHLPNMTQLQTDEATAYHVGPWIASFEPKNLAELNMKMLDVSPEQCRLFLHDFFEFYANFEYGKHFVCPLYGRLIEIKNFHDEMPTRYVDFVAANPEDKRSKFNSATEIAVQDPLQLNHNITKHLSKIQANKIVYFFKRSAEALQ